MSVTEFALKRCDTLACQPGQQHCAGAGETTAQMNSAPDEMSARGCYSDRTQRPVVSSLFQAYQR